jgi:hypothetical protein
VKLLFAALHESGFPIVFCCALLSGAMSISVAAENAPGVTDSEIKIGQTMPFTGGSPSSQRLAWLRWLI